MIGTSSRVARKMARQDAFLIPPPDSRCRASRETVDPVGPRHRDRQMQPPDRLPLGASGLLEPEVEEHTPAERGVERRRPIRGQDHHVSRPLQLLEEHVGEPIVVDGPRPIAAFAEEPVDLVQEEHGVVATPKLDADLLLRLPVPAGPKVCARQATQRAAQLPCERLGEAGLAGPRRSREQQARRPPISGVRCPDEPPCDRLPVGAGRGGLVRLGSEPGGEHHVSHPQGRHPRLFVSAPPRVQGCPQQPGGSVRLAPVGVASHRLHDLARVQRHGGEAPEVPVAARVHADSLQRAAPQLTTHARLGRLEGHAVVLGADGRQAEDIQLDRPPVLVRGLLVERRTELGGGTYHDHCAMQARLRDHLRPVRSGLVLPREGVDHGAQAANFAAQLVVLPQVLGDEVLGHRVGWAWSALSHACHADDMRLPPGAAELRG